MNEILHSVSFLSAGAAGALFSAVWEGAALALGVYLSLRLLPGLSAAARSVVWLNVFVLLVLLHFVPAFAPRATETANAPASAIHLDPRWSLGIVAVWLAFSLWRAVQLVVGVVHLRGLAARAVPVRVDADLEALLADTHGRRAAQLCASDEVLRPSVIGFFRPRILLPPTLVEELSPTELHQVVIHEMEHLRRADDWTNLLQKISLVLFPLNPVLVWVERRLCTERELACDDRVIRSSAGRKAYALCLTRLAELSLFRRSYSLMLGLWERRPELVRRIQRIVSQPVRSMGRRPAIAATGTVLVGALGCAVALAHSPQFVSFVPVHPAVLLASPLDPHVLARDLGGTPQLVKATLPVRTADASQPAGRRKAVAHSMRRAVLKSAQAHKPAGCQIAALHLAPKPVPAQLPALDERQMFVLTEFTTFQAAPRVVLAVTSDRRAAPAVAIPATYAIVPTPSGWLIIQI